MNNMTGKENFREGKIMFLWDRAWKCAVFQRIKGNPTWWKEGVESSQISKINEFWKYYKILDSNNA